MAKKKSKQEPDWSTGENRRPERLEEILDRLAKAYPDARMILDFEDPFQLLCATILAAQATDERVNQVTPELFERWPGPRELAAAEQEEVEEVVRSTGYYRQKSKRLLGMSQALVDDFDAIVPDEVDALTELPGVGRKTAILVVNQAFGKPAGLVVDTHVLRIARRLDLSQQKGADPMERELREVVPQERWIAFQDLFAFHGRARCKAPKPHCDDCPVEDLCYFPDKVFEE